MTAWKNSRYRDSERRLPHSHRFIFGEPGTYPWLARESSSKIRVGHWVLAIGSPSGASAGVGFAIAADEVWKFLEPALAGLRGGKP